MQYQLQLPVLIDHKDDGQPFDRQLVLILELFGRPRTTPLPTKGPTDSRVDLSALLGQIPPDYKGQVNPAAVELGAYLQAIDPKLRRKGAFMDPEALVSLLLERLEYFEMLSRNVAKVCEGRECPYYSVCRYKEIMFDVKKEDGIFCSVERELIKHYVAEFTVAKPGAKATVDPRRTEMAFLFAQLIQLLVQQLRYSMYMQVTPLLTNEFDKLRQPDGSEIPFALNKIEHPLMSGWQRVTKEIQAVLQKMGRTPEFEMRQGLWIDETEKANAERRAIELMAETYESMLKGLAEGTVEHNLVAQALTSARQALVEFNDGGAE
jgi:hypothetical protein